MKKLVSDVIVDVLVSAGVERCYGVVGDTMNNFAHSLEKSSIRFVHMRHEEAGAFAAGAEAEFEHRLTACAGSCGPGSLHFINGLYEANRNRAPVVLIATQIVRSDLGFDSIQEVDFKQVYAGCSVFCDMIYTAEQARRKTVAACQAALSQGGVAVLILTADIAQSPAADELPYEVKLSEPVIRPSDAELDEMAKLLNSSSKITIYAGAGAEGATAEVIELADRLKAPVAHTSRGKDFIEPGNSYNVGMTGLIGEAPGYRAVLDCEVLLLLGADFAWPQFYPQKAKIIQVDIKPTHLGRRHPVEIAAVGSIKPTLEALIPKIEDHPDTKFLDKYLDDYKKLREKEDEEAPKSLDAPVAGSYLLKLIDKYADDDALFTADDGTPLVWLLRHLKIRGGRRTFGSLLHGTMASGMSAALGLKASRPDRQVISVCGDGGFAMLMGDLLTIVQEDLPIKIAIFDNGKLGFVDIEQKASGLIPVYTNLKNPDFAKIAEAVGIWGRKVDTAGETESAVREWLAAPGAALLHVKVKPMQLVTPPSPFVSAAAVVGMANYSLKAFLQGKGEDVWEMISDTRS